jgi:hypothetical protein
MARGVTAARLTLDQVVMVRIHAGQQAKVHVGRDGLPRLVDGFDLGLDGSDAGDVVVQA